MYSPMQGFIKKRFLSGTVFTAPAIILNQYPACIGMCCRKPKV